MDDKRVTVHLDHYMELLEFQREVTKGKRVVIRSGPGFNSRYAFFYTDAEVVECLGADIKLLSTEIEELETRNKELKNACDKLLGQITAMNNMTIFQFIRSKFK